MNWRKWLLSTDSARAILMRHIQRGLEQFGVVLLAWVFLSNHFHVVLQSPSERVFRLLTGWRTRCRHYRAYPRGHQKSTVIAQFMKHVRLGTSKELQQELGLSGRLWEGDYHAREIHNAWDLAVAIAYDHRNPVRAGIVRQPEDHTWSSAGWWADSGESRLPMTDRGLPFDSAWGRLQQTVLKYQASRALDDLAAAMAAGNIRWDTEEGELFVQEFLRLRADHEPAPHVR